jgi:hypothetical protein
MSMCRSHDVAGFSAPTRFWWSLLLALPVVGFSSMFADLLGYSLPSGGGWIDQRRRHNGQL